MMSAKKKLKFNPNSVYSTKPTNAYRVTFELYKKIN